ncbi:778_t:CDS:2, partial [Funneliformis mosseae]
KAEGDDRIDDEKDIDKDFTREIVNNVAKVLFHDIIYPTKDEFREALRNI